MPRTYQVQIAIVGGGICGLWVLNALRTRGYSVALFEENMLGGQQTLASQGMIHGGIKYALGGFTTPSSETIANMPSRWRECLSGNGTINLKGVDLLSDSYYLFSDASVSSKVTAFFGSRSIRGRVSTVDRKDYPPAFATREFKGNLYLLQDIVVDTPSLVRSLADAASGRAFESGVRVVPGETGSIEYLELDDGSRVVAEYYVLSAGAGNEGLIDEGHISIRQQLRPLNQVFVKKSDLPEVYAHAVSLSAGAKPRMTITTHPTADGSKTWYLGGELAESGVGRSEEEQLGRARRELEALFPWLDWHDAQWRTYPINRAEPAQQDRERPDSPFCRLIENALICWPTKLTLTPLVGDEVLKLMNPLPPDMSTEVLPELPLARPGIPPWDLVF